jgi:hypothetical protein
MALRPMDLATVQGVLGLLRQLMQQPIWDVRCGGYLGLKYTLAGRLDLGRQLLQVCMCGWVGGWVWVWVWVGGCVRGGHALRRLSRSQVGRLAGRPQESLPSLPSGLQDSDDDVRASDPP